MKKDISDENGFGTLGDRLPAESRESLEQLLNESSGYFRRARSYVSANPVQAAGIAILGAGALWALFATKPGRKVVDAGKTLVVPALGGLVTSLGSKIGVGANAAATASSGATASAPH